MSLSSFLASHTSRELTEIAGRNRVDPYDLAGRIELAIGKLCALFFNANRDPNKSESLSSADFVPQWGKTIRDETELEAGPTLDAIRTKLAIFADANK